MKKNIEALVSQMGNIYRQFGYSQFKMNKFEEYDIYVNNKDFLKSDKVITFTDTNGKLLALKPDVTISIIKNSDDTEGFIQKVYYNENVYRVSDGTHAFKEIMQSGLECIGDVDDYCICEVLMLAAKSLYSIDTSFMLDISHMGLISSLLSSAGIKNDLTDVFLKAISEKNLPELLTLCKSQELSSEWIEILSNLITMYGPISEISKKLDVFSVNEDTKKSVEEIITLSSMLESFDLAHKIQIDFSVVNDMHYYNGFVFKGYISSIPFGILSGGQYDRLVKKMGKNAKGLGFALYLDMLERLFTENEEFDADVCIHYEKGVSPQKVLNKVNEIIESGKSALAIRANAQKVMCRENIYLTEEDA